MFVKIESNLIWYDHLNKFRSVAAVWPFVWLFLFSSCSSQAQLAFSLRNGIITVRLSAWLRLSDEESLNLHDLWMTSTCRHWRGPFRSCNFASQVWQRRDAKSFPNSSLKHRRLNFKRGSFFFLSSTADVSPFLYSFIIIYLLDLVVIQPVPNVVIVKLFFCSVAWLYVYMPCKPKKKQQQQTTRQTSRWIGFTINRRGNRNSFHPFSLSLSFNSMLKHVTLFNWKKTKKQYEWGLRRYQVGKQKVRILFSQSNQFNLSWFFVFFFLPELANYKQICPTRRWKKK